MKNENLIYKHWIKSNYVSDELKEQMRKMSDRDINYSFSEEPLVFGTAGYRNIVGPGIHYLNKHTYQRLIVAYAKFILKNFTKSKSKKIPKVVIAHDNRENGTKIAYQLANILTAYNIEAYIFPNNAMMPTPVVSFAIRKMNLDGGINITASHNPKEYNGFKAYNSKGSQTTIEESKEIESLLPSWEIELEKSYLPNKKLIKTIPYTLIDDYFEDINNFIGITKTKESNIPIVFTPHHGTCCKNVKKYLESLGHNIVMVESQSYEDPSFTNSPNINPEDHNSFAEAIKTASLVKSDIAIGVDPDGDRMAVAIKHNGKWEYLNGNQTGIIATYYLLNYKQFGDLVPIVISSYVTNSLINNMVASYDGLVLRTGTGFKNLGLAMDQIEDDKACFLLAFEESIGMSISTSIREKDAIASTALIIEIYKFFKNEGLDLIDVLENRIYQKFGFWYGDTISLKIDDKNWKKKAQILEKNALSTKPGKLGEYQIEKVFWNNAGECIEWVLNNGSWIKFRVSGTEPKFKIYINLFTQPKRKKIRISLNEQKLKMK